RRLVACSVLRPKKRQGHSDPLSMGLNRSNVTLVDLKATPIEAITPEGIRTRAGEHALDSIIFATGFDAFTGSLLRMNIRGRGGVRLEDHWAAGPRTLLGFASHS